MGIRQCTFARAFGRNLLQPQANRAEKGNPAQSDRIPTKGTSGHFAASGFGFVRMDTCNDAMRVYGE